MYKHQITVNGKTATISKTRWYTPKQISSLNTFFGKRGYICSITAMSGARLIETIRYNADCQYKVVEE